MGAQQKVIPFPVDWHVVSLERFCVDVKYIRVHPRFEPQWSRDGDNWQGFKSLEKERVERLLRSWDLL